MTRCIPSYSVSANLDSTEWFATQVRIGREHHCAHHLQMRGYEVFLPCYSENRRWSDRTKTIRHPLFAGYLFCRVSGEVMGKIVTLPGVVRIVGDGRRPIAIPAGEIEALQRIVAADLKPQPWPFLETGRRVRLEVGPLRGTEGIVVKSGGGERVVVSISLLRRSVAVEVDAAWLGVPPGSSIGERDGAIRAFADRTTTPRS